NPESRLGLEMSSKMSEIAKKIRSHFGLSIVACRWSSGYRGSSDKKGFAPRAPRNAKPAKKIKDEFFPWRSWPDLEDLAQCLCFICVYLSPSVAPIGLGEVSAAASRTPRRPGSRFLQTAHSRRSRHRGRGRTRLRCHRPSARP